MYDCGSDFMGYVGRGGLKVKTELRKMQEGADLIEI